MCLSYKRIVLPDELEQFYALDREIFGAQDALPAEYLLQKSVWAYWILLGNERIGALVVELDATIADTFDGDSVPAPGTVYSVSIGILPQWRRRGHALAAKRWMVTKAPFIDYMTRVVCNMRRSNLPSMLLSIEAGFKQVETRENYYADPVEDSLVYEYVLA